MLLATALSLCMLVPPVSGETRQLTGRGPIVITAATLTADNRAQTALFEGAVVAKTDTMTLQADRMLVHYADGRVMKIDASGKVRLMRGERIITSDAVVYFAEDEKAVFTGEPRAAEGGNVVTGTRMTYFLRDDRSVVENSKVFIEDRKGR